MMMMAKVYEQAYQSMTLMLLFLCLVSPSYSSYNEDINSGINSRKWEKQRAMDFIGDKSHTLNLCSKDRDMKLVCHCTPEDYVHIKATKADCWIFHSIFVQNDPNWQVIQTQPHLEDLKFTVQRTGSLEYVPTNEIATLQHLLSISIEYAQIKEINSYAFGNLSQLKVISLPKNQIRKLNTHAFHKHTKLEQLNLEQNQIVEIENDAFFDMPNLSTLNLARNEITSIHDDTFKHLTNLVELRLDSNLISILTREIFKGLGNLRTLNISHNNINYIGNTVFAEMWGLQELYLDSNRITKMGDRAFDGLNVLKVLNLANNKLDSLEPAVFTGVPALTLLDLSHNDLQTVTQLNIQPLLDGLVNSTSVLDLTGNSLVCDCRLRWVFDLSKDTKNEALREKLHHIQCDMKPKEFISPDYSDNSILKQSQPDPGAPLYNYDETVFNFEAHRPTERQLKTVLKMTPNQLPCPQEAAQPTELPLQRESISLMDLSWSSKAISVFSCTTTLLAASLLSYVISLLM